MQVASRHAPCILLLEDAHLLFPVQPAAPAGAAAAHLRAELLVQLDKLAAPAGGAAVPGRSGAAPRGVAVLATAPAEGALEGGIARALRMHVYLGLPTPGDREGVLLRQAVEHNAALGVADMEALVR
jgi:hypothetical protein